MTKNSSKPLSDTEENANLSFRRSSVGRTRLNGHSGCKVEVVTEAGGLYIKKSGLTPSTGERLKLQVRKQESARTANRLPFIRIPRVESEIDLDAEYSVLMEYMYYFNSIDFFLTASRRTIDLVVDMLFQFIDSQIAASKMSVLPSQTIIKKLWEVEQALSAKGTILLYKDSLELVSRWATARPIQLPLGPCHGDLTFSNILIAGDGSAIALIDFLDSFVESPIFDLAKLRQDSIFNWSAIIAGEAFDGARFRQVMRHVDRRIVAHYGSENWFVENIDLIQSLNLLRISPYVTSDNVECFLTSAISKIHR